MTLYVQEITGVAASGAHLLIVGAKPVGLVRFLGLDQAEVERRFAPTWTLLSMAEEKMAFANGSAYRHTPVALIHNRFAAPCYLLQRAG